MNPIEHSTTSYQEFFIRKHSRYRASRQATLDIHLFRSASLSFKAMAAHPLHDYQVSSEKQLQKVLQVALERNRVIVGVHKVRDFVRSFSWYLINCSSRSPNVLPYHCLCCFPVRTAALRTRSKYRSPLLRSSPRVRSIANVWVYFLKRNLFAT